jgi:four helix bundle protein
MFDFEKFPVYIKIEELINRLQPLFNHHRIKPHIKDQLYRSSSSIMLNIAEGAGKFSKKDKKNFYLIARGSTQESVSILKLLKIEDNISEPLFEELYNILDEISRMLTGLIKSMDK